MKNLLILFLLGIFTNSGFTQAAKSTDNENKLKNWIAKTEKNSKNYFSKRFSLQEKQKSIH